MAARLVPLSEGSVAVTLDKAITLIGRHPDCDAVLDDNQKISRRHCCIAQVENRLVLRDLGSMNGVRVNGEPVVEVDLREGDEITIGDEEFVLELKSVPEMNKRGRPTDPPTPEKPKRVPNVPAPSPRKAQIPSDLSQEYPIAIPDDMDEDLRLNPPPLPESVVKKLLVNFTDEPKKGEPEEDDDDRGVFKLDSGELELDDLDNLGRKP